MIAVDDAEREAGPQADRYETVPSHDRNWKTTRDECVCHCRAHIVSASLVSSRFCSLFRNSSRPFSCCTLNEPASFLARSYAAMLTSWRDKISSSLDKSGESSLTP